MSKATEMKRALIVMEPGIEFGAGVLNKMNKLRKFLEVNLCARPLIKKLKENCQVSIVSPGRPLAESLSREQEEIPVVARNLSSQDISDAFRHSIKLAQGWYLYGELPELLQIDGVNIGECFQATIMDRLFPLLEQVELADSLLKEEKPDIVYIESDLAPSNQPSGQAFQAVARARGMKYRFMQPTLYRNLKKRLVKRWRYKSFKKGLLTNVLYSINKNADNTSYKILADTPYINYFTTVLPVIQELLSRNTCQCYVLGKEPDVLSKLKGAQRVDIELASIAQYRQRAKKIKTYYHSELENNAQFQNLFEYKGVNFWSALKDDISCLFDRQFIDMILSLDYFHKIMDAVKPDILVFGSQDRITGVAGHALLAKKLAIPMLEIRHGVIHRKAPQGRGLDIISHKIAAGGDYCKEFYIKSGARDEQVVVTGWPKYDIHKSLKDESSKENRNTVNLLFATQPIGIKLNLDIIETIGSFIENHSELRLAVKPHPAERARTYYQTANKYKHVTLHGSRENTARLLARSDALITASSTVGIEAALEDKPIIVINITAKESDSVYVSSGIAIEVKNLDELIPAIKDALYNEEVRARLAEARKKFVYQHAYIQDGQASKRVADLIIQMVDESRKAGVEA